jgi:primase-polymerase (primpol)-like protein
MTMIEHSDTPEELKRYNQWGGWRYIERDGRQTKLPIRLDSGSYASVACPDDWFSSNEAKGLLSENRCDGLAFVFTDEDDLVGIDLDRCRRC